MKSKEDLLLDPAKEKVIARDGEIRRGDIVYLPSGGYPMTVVARYLPQGEYKMYVALMWHNEQGDLHTCECEESILEKAEPL